MTSATLLWLLALTQTSSEWIQLFNGRDLSGWEAKIAGFELGDNYKNTFRVRDGILEVAYDEYESFDEQFGHLFYETPFSHYVLRVEYRFMEDPPPGTPDWAYRNSGAMLHSQSAASMAVDQNFPVSIEAQFLGGRGEGTGERPTANLCTPGMHVEMAGELVTEHCINARAKTYHGDQWVTVEMEVRGGEVIRHRIDGETVIEYEKPVIGGDHLPDGFPLAEGTLVTEGYIALQSEGHPIHFRKVELKDLSGER